MDQAAEILVVIVSSVLSIFLIIAIILGIYLIKLTTEIRKLTKSAKDTVSHIDSAVVGVSKLSSPLFIAEIVNRYIKKITTQVKKGKK
jgi:cobalamin biosynthesis protein CobD/CbiB